MFASTMSVRKLLELDAQKILVQSAARAMERANDVVRRERLFLK